MSEISLGIIGAGGIAKEHLKVIQALNDVNPVGITSRTLSKAQELAKTFHIQIPDSSWQEYLRWPKHLVKINQSKAA